MRDDFIMEIRCGSSINIEELETVIVNDETSHVHINNQFYEGYVKVRLRDYDGLPVDSNKMTLHPNSPYFNNNSGLSSIEISGIFKNGPLKDGAWPASDIYFGNHFNSPLNLPPGYLIIKKFATYFDPGLKMELDIPKPYAHSPLLVTLNTVNITKLNADESVPKTLPATEGRPLKEDCKIIPELEHINDNYGSHRRQILSKSETLENVKLNSDTLVRGDFYNPYLDFNKRGIKIPLLTIPIMRYWGGQPLTYVCRSLSNPKGNIFFVVSIILRPINEIFFAVSSPTDLPNTNVISE